MAVIHHLKHAHHSSLLGLLAAPFIAVFNALMTMAEQSPRMREIDRLRAMSDAELASRGLTRDRIIQHVFRDTL